jgi:hypothetical protein
MSSSMTSNVYYLPVRREAPEVAERHAQPVTAWSRLVRAWWRARFTSAEVWRLVRRSSRTLFADDTLMQHRFEPERFRPRLGPARIIDFDTARTRLRPQQA